jgi:hypothetical protein
MAATDHDDIELLVVLSEGRVTQDLRSVPGTGRG